jgi:hypothetical protein
VPLTIFNLPHMELIMTDAENQVAGETPAEEVKIDAPEPEGESAPAAEGGAEEEVKSDETGDASLPEDGAAGTDESAAGADGLPQDNNPEV